MKKTFVILFLILAGVAHSRASEVKTYSLNVRDFTELQVVDYLNVVHKCNSDSAGLAVFTCADNIVPAILFTNKNNKLKIEWNMDSDIPVSCAPLITVYSNYIQSVENCGEGLIEVISPAPGALFKARVIGNGSIVATDIHATQTEGNLDTGKGEITLQGLTRVAKLKNIGKGNINAENLSSEQCTVTILGTGPVECNVSGELNVKGMGSGKVYVRGNPVIKKRTIGSIEVITKSE